MFTCICLRDHTAGPYRFSRGEYFTAEMKRFMDLPEPVPAIRTDGIFSGWAITNSPEGSWAVIGTLRPAALLHAGFAPDEPVRNMTDEARRVSSETEQEEPPTCNYCGAVLVGAGSCPNCGDYC